MTWVTTIYCPYLYHTGQEGVTHVHDVSHTASDQRFWHRARRHMLGYGGDFVPVVPVHAEGSFLYDASGRRVLDFTSGQTGQISAILGHSHPEIVATVREQVSRLDHLFSSMLNEPVVALPERLAGMVPELEVTVSGAAVTNAAHSGRSEFRVVGIAMSGWVCA